MITPRVSVSQVGKHLHVVWQCRLLCKTKEGTESPTWAEWSLNCCYYGHGQITQTYSEAAALGSHSFLTQFCDCKGVILLVGFSFVFLFCGICFFLGGGVITSIYILKHPLLLKEALLQMEGTSTHRLYVFCIAGKLHNDKCSGICATKIKSFLLYIQCKKLRVK